MKAKYLLLILMAITVFSCKDEAINNAYITIDDMPAAGYLKSNPSEFSMWVDLLEYTNLYNALNLSGNYTCFVPTNEAITEYLLAKGKANVRDFDLTFAEALVKYHVIKTPTKRYTQSFFENGVIPDSTASGDYLSIEIRGGGLNAIYVNSQARIKQLDIEVTNAVIHSIEKVLDPITETVWEKVTANASYSIFKEAISATGYDTLLNNKQYNATLFAVTNSVFSNKGILELADLTITLGAGIDYTSHSNALNKFVAYHILPQQLSFTELATFSTSVLSKNINTLASNEIINVSDVDGTLFLNRDTSLKDEYKLTTYNINSKNGIIHEIDGLMPVYSPKPASYIWEFTDYPELASLFKSVYKITTLTSNSSNFIKEGDVECYRWKTVLPDNMNTVVKYYVHKNLEERYKAKNADYLRIRLGLYGWIEMNTSAIVKGTYNLKIAHHSPLKSVYKFTFILDGNVIGIITLPSDTNKDLYYSGSTLASNITFSDTKEHKVRLLANDNSELELDYILFEPVN